MAIVKAMVAKGYVPQDIQAYFSRPTRSINHARVSEIRDGLKHKAVKSATDEELDEFLDRWPDLDPATGLNLTGDELLIKAREAMISAVHTFNGAGLHFRAELFIVTAIISWTYLMHAFYKREGVDYRYTKNGVVQQTSHGSDKYWELSQCITHGRCPLPRGVVNNLRFLIGIRNEIEHRSTNRIDEALGAKLQACCLNFNDAIKTLFGRGYALEKQLPIALQFVTFDAAQRARLKAAELPANIATAMEAFHNSLSIEEQEDPHFRYRVAFVPKLAGKATASDIAIDFVKPGSAEAEAIERIFLKDVEKPKFVSGDVIKWIRRAGFPNFNMHDHTLVARQYAAKNPDRGFGVQVVKQWYWYQNWLEFVLAKLQAGWTRRNPA